MEGSNRRALRIMGDPIRGVRIMGDNKRAQGVRIMGDNKRAHGTREIRLLDNT